jgi:hypothetical protein
LKPQCIITGCILVDTAYGRYAIGDLHELGGAYIFGANQTGGQIDWHYSHVQHDGDRVITVNGNNTFVRGATIVVDKSDASLNDAAAAYIDYLPGT